MRGSQLLSDWTQEETHSWYWKPGQESMAEESIRSKAKATIVYPARGQKSNFPLNSYFSATLRPDQRSFSF